MPPLSTADFSTFVAILALALWVGTFAVWILLGVHRFRPEGFVAGLIDDLRRAALWLAWLVALGTTLGSLYYSEIAHFIPCKLCWYQRIVIYPLVFILLVGAIRRDRKVAWYVAPQVVVGIGISIYHTYIQAFPESSSPFCTTTEPCTVRYVWEFGFVSLPFMALTAMVFILTMVLVAVHADAESPDERASLGAETTGELGT